MLGRRQFLRRAGSIAAFPGAVLAQGGKPRHGHGRVTWAEFEVPMRSVTVIVGNTYWVNNVETDPAKFGVESGHPYYDTIAVDVGENAAFTGNGASPYVEA
jgi:hypothetical protein